jgi:peptidoglycan/xylan/chitin deacetylase (PgdA/CDA1 family)
MPMSSSFDRAKPGEALFNISVFRKEMDKPIRKMPDTVCNEVCLTFDDGPDPLYTQKILDILAEYRVKASFFVLGSAAKTYPQLVEKMAEAGHSIGNHTYSHSHPWLVTSAYARDEVTRTSELIKKIIGYTPRWFRPPFGRLRTSMCKQANAEQMATVLWNHSIIDWGLLGTRQGISNRLAKVKAGDIVLMHDGKREKNRPEILIDCLPDFLESLKDKSLVTSNLDEAFC